MKLAAIVAVMFSAMAQLSEAALIGTNLGFETVFQSLPTSQEIKISSTQTVTVTEPGIEIPSVKALEVSNPSGLSLVDVSVNAGDNFIDIGFANSAPFSLFASGFRNSYVFTFDSAATPTITSASIDRSLTTLGLSDSDVTFLGNKLEVNVEGLSFNPTTFARIDLTSVNPVPLPPAVWLFGTGLAALVVMKKRKAS